MKMCAVSLQQLAQMTEVFHSYFVNWSTLFPQFLIKSGLGKSNLKGGHPLSTYAKFFEKLTFLATWYAHVRVRIRGLEMLVFRKILSTYLMDDPQEIRRTSIHKFKVPWNDHLVNYFPLMYRYGINTNILHLTFSRAEFSCKILIIIGISNEKTNE